MPPKLTRDLAAWDGKSMREIKRLFDTNRAHPDFIETLVGLMPDPELQFGATWLIKHALEKGEAPLAGPVLERFYESTPDLAHWEARLHVLQVIPMLAVPPSCKSHVKRFVDESFQSGRTLLRAWSYTGADCLADAFPEFRADVDRLLEQGAATETAGSVKVRIRRALEKRASGDKA